MKKKIDFILFIAFLIGGIVYSALALNGEIFWSDETIRGLGFFCSAFLFLYRWRK